MKIIPFQQILKLIWMSPGLRRVAKFICSHSILNQKAILVWLTGMGIFLSECPRGLRCSKIIPISGDCEERMAQYGDLLPAEDCFGPLRLCSSKIIRHAAQRDGPAMTCSFYSAPKAGSSMASVPALIT